MEKSYNERLFNKRQWRGKLHLARYDWLQKWVAQLVPNCQNAIELGCFDAKTLHYLPTSIQHYVGYDANWENGLDEGRQKWKNEPNVQLIEAHTAAAFNPSLQYFDISICMETLEHLPLVELDNYLMKLAASTKQYCFVTIPNERGFLMVLKYVFKKYILRHTPEVYTFRELWYALIGKIDKIERIEGGHKGFDYQQLIKQLGSHFEVVAIEGIPFKWLPLSWSFTVGIVLKQRT
jgi:hypothetical protein